MGASALDWLRWDGKKRENGGRILSDSWPSAAADDIRRRRPAATTAVQPVQGRLAMTNVPLAAIKACVFDAYGTLFDFAAAARGCRAALGANADKLTALWRDKQLQYTWLRSLAGRYADFWQVTGEALDFALETIQLADPGLRERLMNLYLKLSAFPDAADALRRLKTAGLATAILSN